MFCQELWSFWDVTSLAELCTYTYEFCRNTRHWVKENIFLLILITRSIARIKMKNWSLTSRLAAKQWALIKVFQSGWQVTSHKRRMESSAFCSFINSTERAISFPSQQEWGEKQKFYSFETEWRCSWYLTLTFWSVNTYFQGPKSLQLLKPRNVAECWDLSLLAFRDSGQVFLVPCGLMQGLGWAAIWPSWGNKLYYPFRSHKLARKQLLI